MWNRWPVQVQCMKQGTLSWCTRATLRDGKGREVGGVIQDGGHMYTHGWFMSVYGKNHHNIVISHGCTCVSHPELPFHLLPHPIPQGHPSAPSLSILFHASNLNWWSISHMIIYMLQCYSLKSSHPRLLPQSPKVCSLHLCLFCCLTYRVIVTIFLNSIYTLIYCIGIFLSDLFHSV